MGTEGERRRSMRRWAVGVWVAAVVAGGGATVWLQHAAEAPPPVGWEEAEPSPSPERRCTQPDDLPEPPEGDGIVAYACLTTNE